MFGKWILFVVLDLIIRTYSSPGHFYHDYHSGHDKPGWGQDWSHGWEHDWYGGPTTQRARTRGTTKTTEAPSRVAPSSSPTTLPQPTISDLDIRLGEITTTSDAPSTQFIQADTLADQQAFQPFVSSPSPPQTAQPFLSGPEEENTEIPATSTVKAAVTNVLEAKPDEKASLWHVAIYQIIEGWYEHTCGGSLIKEDTVVSAAHCFWSAEGQELPTTLFRVVAGMVYSTYEDPRNRGGQISDIKNISTTGREEPCFQPDLAILILATPVKYTDTVKPLCINFWRDLEKQQLKEGNFGTVPTWSVLEDGECRRSYSRLTWLSLQFVKEKVCQYKISSKTTGRDRICAGEMNNATQCETDSGNGLVFYQNRTPYLRGVTTNIIKHRQCTKFYTRSFTNIIGNADNLKKPFKNILDNINLEECVNFYENNGQTEAPITTTTESDYGDGLIGVDPSEDNGGFTTQAIGSNPVPTLPGSNAPTLQWHVGIYSKAWAPFMQVCGGSLVKRDFVISAAHCFWDDAAGQQPASQFAVAGGQLFRPWNDTQNTFAQHSDVSQITLPVRFRGSATSFQDDIAILRLRSPFIYAPGVLPVCISFDGKFEVQQLQQGNRGTVLGWGLTKENGGPSQRLNFLDLPYVDVEQCYADSDPAFLKFITSDKICAGDTTSGKALCRGDSGGGFVVYAGSSPYLHGVASTAAGNNNLCNAFAMAAITSIYSHRSFIRHNIPDIDKECANTEPAATERNVGLEPTDMGSTGNLESTGNVGSIGNQGSNVIGGTVSPITGNAGGTSTAFPHLPYYPNHFVCNCNCKN